MTEHCELARHQRHVGPNEFARCDEGCHDQLRKSSGTFAASNGAKHRFICRERGCNPERRDVDPDFPDGYFELRSGARTPLTHDPARSSGLLPDAFVGILQQASFMMTLVAMAGLGLSVDMRSIAASGGKVLTVGVVSILCVVALAILSARLVALT